MQELVLDDFGDLESGLLILTKRIFTDELHDFDEIVFLLEDGLDALLVSHEFGISCVIIFRKNTVIVGIRNIPIYRWEMLSLGEFLIQSPKDLHNIQSSRGNWIGEITTWWGYSTDNGNGTSSVW